MKATRNILWKFHLTFWTSYEESKVQEIGSPGSQQPLPIYELVMYHKMCSSHTKKWDENRWYGLSGNRRSILGISSRRRHPLHNSLKFWLHPFIWHTMQCPCSNVKKRHIRKEKLENHVIQKKWEFWLIKITQWETSFIYFHSASAQKIIKMKLSG